MKLLFVVHRYAPFPGGSEYHTQRIAEEAVKQGHDVTVLSDAHQGDLNGVKLTGDHQRALFEEWDMIWVHGSCPTQDVILANSAGISSPIYYLLVQPSDAPISQLGMRYCSWIGTGTSFDLEHVKKYGHEEKARKYHYPIPDTALGNEGFRERYGITTKRMYVSAGGFWPHKRFEELVKAFREAKPRDTTLVLLGYDTQHGRPPIQGDGVINLIGATQQDVYDALYEADLYVMNSNSEGYGLVLLESMLNWTPWISRDIAAGHDLSKRGLGTSYTTYEELVALLKNPPQNWKMIERGNDYVTHFHSPANALNDVLSVLSEVVET